jgi:hypothetical protein
VSWCCLTDATREPDYGRTGAGRSAASLLGGHEPVRPSGVIHCPSCSHPEPTLHGVGVPGWKWLAPMITQTIGRTVREMASHRRTGRLPIERFVVSALADSDQGHIMSTGSIALFGDGDELLERRDEVVRADVTGTRKHSDHREVAVHQRGDRGADLTISAP